MEIVNVAGALAAHGLTAPKLNALVPNETNYTVLLMQPAGQIEAGADGVKNRDQVVALRQHERFLADARQTQADLAVTPEYSMPWKVLIQAIQAGNVPAIGKLWAFGCESIRYGELDALRDELGQLAVVIAEPLPGDPHRFTDPLAYVFFAPSSEANGTARLVVLVQFKTFPMGDNNHFEIAGLQRGTCIYQFGGDGNSLRFISLICSDAFDFLDQQASTVYDRALVLHIQLNAKPRHELYRQYRDRIMRFNGDQTEVICLNWAENVHEWCGELDKPWNNISGSAWYLRPSEFDKRDETLCANHRRGLYYTWMESHRAHALFFNYSPATFFVEATKVAHVGVPAAVSRRRGPQLRRMCVWDDAAADWVDKGGPKDGFCSIVDESGAASDDLKQIAAANPLSAERLLALCSGQIGNTEDWYDVSRLDSCGIDLSEVIRRLTFCQDTDTAARNFRIARLRRCGRLWTILNTHELIPPALAELRDGFRLEWSADSPHQNVISTQGRRATVIYMGEDVNYGQVKAIAKTVAEFLHRWFADEDQSLSAKQRLAVWFRDEDQTKRLDTHQYVQIDQARTTSEFDIGREA